MDQFQLRIRYHTSKSGSEQVRRVRLPCIDDGNGKVSYDELLNTASSSIDGESNVSALALRYTDADGDLVTIASSDELSDAIEQCSDATPRVLRIDMDMAESLLSNEAARVASAVCAPASVEATAVMTSRPVDHFDRGDGVNPSQHQPADPSVDVSRVQNADGTVIDLDEDQAKLDFFSGR